MIFVTGATGFLGSYLVRNLIRKGEKVRALRRSTSTFELPGDFAKEIEWVEGDLLDIPSLEIALEGVEKIYHCAGIFSGLRSEQEKVLATNARGSANLFNMALAKKVKKVVHVSSTIALGVPLNGAVIDENYYAGSNKLGFDYFKGKKYAELEAWRANAEGLELVIVNPGGLLGAGHWLHQPLNAFPAVYAGLSFYAPGTNGFVDVRDVVELMVRLMESEISGERFILVSENVQLKDFLGMIADELKAKRPGYKMTKLLAELGWRFELLRALASGEAPRFTKLDLRIARIPFSYDNSKIIRATGFSFRAVAQTIHDCAQSFLESKKKGLDYGTFD